MVKVILLGDLMKYLLIAFLFLLLASNVNAIPCIIGLENTATAKECLKNQDLNISEVIKFNGIKSFDFDVNVTIIRENDGTVLVSQQAMSQAPQTGKYFFEVIGGFANSGEYSVIIDAEHTAGGSPDGNGNSATYNFTLLDQNTQTAIGDIETSILAEVNVPQVCNFKLNTSFLLGQYLYFTLSGFDTNGNQLSSATFDLFRGNEKLINAQSMEVKTDFLQFVFDRKFNNDVYLLVIRSSDCKVTRFCNNLNGGCS